jgi:DNA-binding transcriptional LysR family regulator
MNSSQILSFLTAVEKLSFTVASEQLFISQPGLSRQIAAMEEELGVKLFTRGRNSIRITDAGQICKEHMKRIQSEYLEMLGKIEKMKWGEDYPLILGGLEGQLVGKCYEDVLSYFWITKPNISIQMVYYSASRLCKALAAGEVDIAILPEAEVKDIPGISWRRSREDKCCLVVPYTHPKASDENATLKDFANETFLVLAENDSSAIAKQHLQICNSVGFTPKQRIVPTFGTLSMLLEMGVGISVLNVWHSLRNNPQLKFLYVPEVGYRAEAVAWLENNMNPNIELFLSQLSNSNE